MIDFNRLGNNWWMAKPFAASPVSMTLGEGSFRPRSEAGSDVCARDPAERMRMLVIEHFDFVWRLLRRLGVPEADVDDAVQQVFIVVANRLGSIPSERERSFVIGTALRTAATLRRNERRRQRWWKRGPPTTPSTAACPTNCSSAGRRSHFGRGAERALG